MQISRYLFTGMHDKSMRSGMELAQKFQLTDWSTAGILPNQSSGIQIPCDICTKYKYHTVFLFWVLYVLYEVQLDNNDNDDDDNNNNNNNNNSNSSNNNNNNNNLFNHVKHLGVRVPFG